MQKSISSDTMTTDRIGIGNKTSSIVCVGDKTGSIVKTQQLSKENSRYFVFLQISRHNSAMLPWQPGYLYVVRTTKC